MKRRYLGCHAALVLDGHVVKAASADTGRAQLGAEPGPLSRAPVRPMLHRSLLQKVLQV